MSSCPPTNKTQSVDADKTIILKKQAELLAKNVSKVFKFSFKFKRHGPEFQKIDKIEREEDRLGNVRRKGYLDFEQIGFSEPALYEYRATIRLSIKQALELLSSYGVNLAYSVQSTYTIKDEEGEEKQVPYPRKPDEKAKTPRAGIATRFKRLDKTKANPYPHIPPQTAQVLVSHEFDIAEGYLPGWHANREDYLVIRKGLWHEIMESALIAIAVEALYWPRDLYYDLDSNPENNFANNAVVRVQRAMEAIREDRRLFLYWEGDPPFDSSEVGAYTRENEARRLEDDAIRLEGQGNWAGAREKWIEAEQAWEIAIRAWQAVPQHPGREQRIKDAQTKLAEAREKREIAQWEGASWNVTSTSSGEINIRYSA